MITDRTAGILLVVLGASAWGTLGVFATALYKAGLRPLDVIVVRVLVAWVGYAMMAMLSNRQRLRVAPREMGWLALNGLIAVALYNLFYFGAIEKVGITLAVALLYTAPAWGAVLGYLFLGERHPARVYLAVPVSVLGVALAVTNADGLTLGIPLNGLLLGLGAALAYTLFSILGKPVLRDCSSLTLLFYSFGIGGLVLVAVGSFEAGWDRLLSATPAVWLVLVAVGVLPTFLAYLAYVEGLRRTPASLATLLATAEPVVAVALGIILAGEHLSVYQLCGLILVVAATVIAARGRAETIQAAAFRTEPACNHPAANPERGLAVIAKRNVSDDC